MKNQRHILCVYLALLLLFVAVSAFVFNRSQNLIEQGYLASEGKAAENFAVLTAENIHLTDAQVARLKQYSYTELMASEENQALKSMMDNDGFSSKVDYAYIMIHLKGDEIKYQVIEEVAERFDAPVGTKLDIMWLLDVNVSAEAAQLQQNAYMDEYSRFSYYIEEDAQIFGEAPTYIYNSSEWGDHICGYAPIYTTEGNYIGVMGVELQTGDYTTFCDDAVLAMGSLLIISLILLSLLFVYVYLNNRKLQFDKIYRDALTQVYNRTYYNSRFAKIMNKQHSGQYFALLIADVDWFKKVNDTFGHDVGDEVLTELAAILSDAFGLERMVRFGGEEFVAGIWVENERELTDRLDELYRKIDEKKFTFRELTLTISLGCSYYKAETIDGWLLSGLLRAADCKLYEAKESGRRQYLVEEFQRDREYKKATSDTAKSDCAKGKQP